jgi:hypothetical protein
MERLLESTTVISVQQEKKMKVGDLVKIGETWSTGVILGWHTPKVARVLWHGEVRLIGLSQLETIK